MTIAADSWLPLVVDLVAKASIVWLLASVGSRTLAKLSSSVHHRVWGFASAVVVVLPALAWGVPGWRVPMLAGWAPVASRPATLPDHAEIAPDLIFPPSPLWSDHEPATLAQALPALDPIAPAREARRSLSSGDWLALIWAGGFLVVAVPTLVGLIGNESRRRRSRRVVDPDWLRLLDEVSAQLAIERPVTLIQTDEAVIPLTWGIMRPVILIPSAADAWSESTRRLVLLHELAHVARRDVGWHLLARLAAALYWFHPLAWLALARLRAEAEGAADDLVVAGGVAPSTYAAELLSLARRFRAPRFVLGLEMARTFPLEHRMIALFDDARSHAPLPRTTARALALVALMALTMGLIHPERSTAEPTTPPLPPPAPVVMPLDPPTPQAPAPPAEGRGRIEGRVVRDADGGVVAGATVQMVGPPPPGRTIASYQLFPRSATTDDQGRFAFADLQAGDYQVWSTVDDLTSRARMIGEHVILPPTGEGLKAVELRLKPGASLAADVKDQATGQPIAGATVHFRYGSFGPEFTTGADGRVVARPLTKEVWEIEVWAPNHALLKRQINLESGLPAAEVFLLGPGGAVEGIVRDPSGQPLAGVGLSLALFSDIHQVAYVETDKNGHYRLDHLALNQAFQIRLSKPDYQNATKPVTITAASRTLDIVLEPRPDGGSVAGLILGPDGRPVAGADVSNPGRSSNEVRATKTGPDGRYQLDNLFPPTTTGREIFIRAAGLAPERLEVTPGPRAAPAVVNATLKPGHQLNARAVDEDGQPLAGVTVYLDNRQIRQFSGESRTTKEDGRFTFDSLPTAAVAPTRLRLVEAGFSEIADRVVPLDTPSPTDVVLTVGGVIAGRVVDAITGQPVPRFNVRITFAANRGPNEPQNGLLSSLIDPGQNFDAPEGRFLLKSLVVGMSLRVMIAAPGFETLKVEPVVVSRSTSPAQRDYLLVPIVATNLVTYAGRLRQESGPVPVGTEVRLIARDRRDPADQSPAFGSWSMIRTGQAKDQPGVVRFLATTTDAEGRFRFDPVPRGAEVMLAWWGAGVGPEIRAGLDKLDAPGKAALDLTVDAPAKLVLVVDRAKFPTAERVDLNLQRALLFDSVDRDLPAPRSEVTIDNLAPGDYFLRLTPGFRPDPNQPNGLISPEPLATKRVIVQPGETLRVEF